MEAHNPLFSSQIYPYIHQFLLEIGGCKQAGFSSEKLFAEVFSLCCQATTDNTPGENITSRYADDLRSRIGNNRTAELILSLTWVVLKVQEKLTYAQSTFTQQLQPLIRHASIYNKAHKLAVTIRQHERHIQTDFLATNSQYPKMKVQIEGNPGSGNTYHESTYNINNVETFAPNATTVVNKHYHISGVQGLINDEAIEATVEHMDRSDNLSAKKSQKATVDIEPIRQEILTWVSKVRPFLCDSWKSDYMDIWDDILNMQEVKEKVYNPGKQKNTNFNQYLLGNILYFMFEDCGAWNEDKDYNASEVCMKLIGTTEHQLRKELVKNPPEEIKNRLHDYFTKKFQL